GSLRRHRRPPPRRRRYLPRRSRPRRHPRVAVRDRFLRPPPRRRTPLLQGLHPPRQKIRLIPPAPLLTPSCPTNSRCSASVNSRPLPTPLAGLSPACWSSKNSRRKPPPTATRFSSSISVIAPAPSVARSSTTAPSST